MSTENEELIKWAREFAGPGSAGVNELADALVAATKPVTVEGLDLNEIRSRITNCRTYNFGMRDADQLAHVDAPAMLEVLEAGSGSPHVDAKHWHQLQEARVRIAELEAVAEPRTVNTVEELDALPVGSVVLDAVLAVCEKDHGREPWLIAGSDERDVSTQLFLPATVLHAPRQEGK